MKKIAFIANVDWYFKLHWLERANYFKSLGFDIHIICRFTDDKIKQQLISDDFNCHDLSINRHGINLFREIHTIFSIKRIINSIRPDIIHSITIKPNVYAGIINRLSFRLPIVYSVTGLGIVFSSGFLRFKLIKTAVVVLYRFISVTNSKFIFENENDHLILDDYNVLKFNNGTVIKGAGIDLNRFYPSRPKLKRNILFAARLLQDKGLDVLIEAKHILASKGCFFNLNVAGIIDKEASSTIPLKKLEEWDKGGDIFWLGEIDDMPRLISDNDIVCLPTSYGEGVPRILIEAAACQRAIVASNIPGCSEIVEHGKTGFLTKIKDANDLSNYLFILLEKNELQLSFGMLGRLKVEREFSQEIVFRKTQLVYQELLQQTCSTTR